MDASTEALRIPVAPDQSGRRLDAFLAAQLPWRSRSELGALLAAGAVSVGRRRVKKSLRLSVGDVVVVQLPAPPPADVGEPIVVPILHEDDDLVVVDKPGGLPVHAVSGYQHHNLIAALQRRDAAQADDRARPSVIHRLDRTTTGVIAVARRRELVAFYTGQFERRTVDKRYVAIVDGQPPDRGAIDRPILALDGCPAQIHPDGRPSRTDYRVLRRGRGHAMVEVAPRTGRKHQIRVHLAAAGHPLVHDAVYGAGPTHGDPHPALHASRLELDHRDGRRMVFEAPIPGAMGALWNALEPGT